MTTEQLAATFTAALRADDTAAYQALWAEDIVSLEPGDGDGARTEGREGLLAKHAWWDAQAEMHDFQVEGPFVHGDQFALRFQADFTMKNEAGESQRQQFTEIALYTVRNGQIAEERFFSDSAS